MDIVTKQSPKQRVESSNMSSIGIVTTLSALYVIPDLTPVHFQELMDQIDLRPEKITIRNISDVFLVVPFRIIRSVVLIEDLEPSRFETLWERVD